VIQMMKMLKKRSNVRIWVYKINSTRPLRML